MLESYLRQKAIVFERRYTLYFITHITMTDETTMDPAVEEATEGEDAAEEVAEDEAAE